MNDSKSKTSLNLQLLFHLNDPKHLHGLKTCLKVDIEKLKVINSGNTVALLQTHGCQDRWKSAGFDQLTLVLF